MVLKNLQMNQNIKNMMIFQMKYKGGIYMKKIVATFLFLLTTLSFALGDASADVEVYAEVLGPLEIETTPVNFGVVAKNSNRNTPQTEGTNKYKRN